MGVILKDEYYQDKTLLQGTFFSESRPRSGRPAPWKISCDNRHQSR